ncbi:hypothetical protein [Belliella pelovolcani]|uniref:Uncharacterized protein n=1 Tax=Belliella pelovolcani TaxID=529505 RepID=A0A1N7NVN2_9BACT|nr:hypothetical protein [Belliella pelovolcani]SIT02413.1 hypothetical protein SAMN05421761_11213 [Belliella pelovolcani]
MNKILFVLIIYWVLSPIQVNSQSLLPPLEEMPFSKDAYILLKDGTRINGELVNTSSGRGVSRVVLKDESGIKHSYKADNIFELGIFSNGLVKAQYFNESSASIKALFRTDRSAIQQNDYVVFRNAQLKGGKELLLQLLNPHFDEHFQVFHAVNARKTTSLHKGMVTISGEMQRVYLVSKDGSEIFKVKKGTYKKAFKKMFSDCDALKEIKRPKFKDFGQHIFYYSNSCSHYFYN